MRMGFDSLQCAAIATECDAVCSPTVPGMVCGAPLGGQMRAAGARLAAGKGWDTAELGFWGIMADTDKTGSSRRPPEPDDRPTA